MKISGFCERCATFSPFLERRRDTWLCTVCYDETRKLSKMVCLE